MSFIPGDNLLDLALDVIDQQTPVYLHRFLSRAVASNGREQTTYADPVEISGSVQSVNRARYKELGLDMARNYVTIFTSVDLKTVERDTNGDVIEYDSKKYQCASDVDWMTQDGWNAVLCVQIPSVRKTAKVTL